MHHAAKRRRIADTNADCFSVAHADSVADELTHPVAFADLSPFIRSGECAVHERRLGARRCHSSLPLVGPR